MNSLSQLTLVDDDDDVSKKQAYVVAVVQLGWPLC